MTVFSTNAYETLVAMLIAYLLGSIPVASLVSRSRGVNIFSAGTRLAGAANVFRTVGPVYGGLVFMGDLSKAMLAIVVAHRLGVENELIMLPAMATLAGHWRSVFSRFRGGDGLSTLVGITVAILSVYALPALVTGGIVAVIARSTGHHASLWGGTAGYSFLLLRSPMSGENTTLVLGVVLLALMVLAHSVIGHRRRREASA